MELQLWQWLVVFAGTSAVLVWASMRLAHAGDEVATATGFGGLFIGVVLTATATSLPELVTAGSAAFTNSPELAVGGLVGSNLANMAILAFLDLISRRRVWPSVELGHARVASVAIALTALAVLFIVTPSEPSIGWVGVDTLVIGLVYAAALAWFRRVRTVTPGVVEEVPAPMGWSRRVRARTGAGPALRRFAVAAGLVLAIGPFVTLASEGIIDTSGLGATFVGAAFLAVATSLPELVASVTAVRMGAYDLAVGNLFGSNAMNIALLLFVDLAYRPGPILGVTAVPVVIAAGVGAILLTALALAAVVHGEETRLRRLEPDAVLVLAAYVGILWLLSTLPD